MRHHLKANNLKSDLSMLWPDQKMNIKDGKSIEKSIKVQKNITLKYNRKS